MNRRRRYIYIAVSILFWVGLWQYLSVRLHQSVFLPSVSEVVLALRRILSQGNFLSILFRSISRIGLGFLLAFLIGSIAAFISSYSEFVRMLLLPPVKFMQAVPVASFIILALLWVKSDNLSTLISFMMAFPTIYINLYEGFQHRDSSLLMVAQAYQIPAFKKFVLFSLPQVRPYLLSGCKIALGFCFKSGIAAEVIGLVQGSIGRQLYDSKLYLSTDELFAWTFVIIIAGYVFEKFCYYVLTGILKSLTTLALSFGRAYSSDSSASSVSMLCCNEIVKTYDSHTVLDSFSKDFTSGTVYCLMGASGRGKTTLLHVLAGIISIDSGSLNMERNKTVHTVSSSDFSLKAYRRLISIDFQENRLLSDFSVYDNIRALYGNHFSKTELSAHLQDLGLTNCIDMPVDQLSGGMKRRLCLLLALLNDRPVCLLDEPCSGLDDKSRQLCINKIKALSNDRIIIFVTHEKSDAELLDAAIITL